MASLWHKVSVCRYCSNVWGVKILHKLSDGESRVDVLGAHIGAVHDGLATI